METKYNIGDKVNIEFEIKSVGSKEPGQIVYEVESDKLHRPHSWFYGKLFVKEDDVTEVPKINITGVTVTEEDNIITLTATGENIDEKAEYGWEINCGENTLQEKSTGPVLTLSAEHSLIFDGAEQVSAVIMVEDYVSPIIEIKGFDPVISSVSETREENHVILTAEGRNLDPEAEYLWNITMDQEYRATSTGPALTLTDEETTAYDAAETVTATISVGEYTSETITIKETPAPVVSITGINESLDGDNNVVLSLVGTGLDESETYGWDITLDSDNITTSTTGTTLNLDETQTQTYTAATSVSAVVTVGDYTSEVITIK